MQPSTITPSGAPHNRGLLVQLPDGRKGRTFLQRLFVEEKVAVYLEIDDGVYSSMPTLIKRNQVKVVSYIE